MNSDNINIVKDFLRYYENFDMKNVDTFSQIYSEDVVFTDPFHTIKGKENLLSYFQRLMSKVKSCRFVITDCIEDQNSAVVVWKMTFFHPMIDRRKEIEVSGTTHIKFNKQVFYHRDYFDSSELIYRHLPLVGSLVRFIEGRM